MYSNSGAVSKLRKFLREGEWVDLSGSTHTRRGQGLSTSLLDRWFVTGGWEGPNIIPCTVSDHDMVSIKRVEAKKCKFWIFSNAAWDEEVAEWTNELVQSRMDMSQFRKAP